MGTLATVLAGKGIKTTEDRYWADVEGDIKSVNNVLKITQIRVTYHLKGAQDKALDAKEALSSYITSCPAAQSVIGCIDIQDQVEIEAA